MTKQNLKSYPCRSKRQKGLGHVNIAQHVGLVISVVPFLGSFKSINK